MAEFLIFSPSFPRSIRYSLERLYQYLHLLTETENGVCNTPEEEAFEKLLGDMRTLSIDDVFNLGLHEFLGNIQSTIDHLDDFLYQEFMYHPPTDMEAEIRLHQQEMQQQQQPAA